jgi:LPS sulfotransferase NodH
MSKPPFVIITLPRSGSYHLRALLDSAPDIRCYGEIFKGSEVELPPEELAAVGLGKKDTEKRDAMGMQVLNRLRKKTDAADQIFGFKDFRFNLARAKIYQQITNSQGWRKVFLARNPIERYISMERADLTGVFVVTEKNKDAGLDLKRPIRFDP